MPSVTYDNITDTNTEWNTGTLVNTATRGDALQVDKTPVIYRHDFDTMSTWTDIDPAAGTFSIVPGAGKYGTVGQASGKCWMVNDSVNFPYDPAKLYEVSGRVRQVTQGASSLRMYMGITGVASDGVTLLNVTGQDVHSSEHYFAASGYHLQPGEEWKTFRGYFTGHGTVNNSGGQNDPVNPGEMYTGVAFIRPMFILNYDNTDGVAEIAYMQIREVSSPVNHALNKDVWTEHKSTNESTYPKTYITNGNRDTLEYYNALNSGTTPAHVTVDLGSPLPINQIGIWHFYNDTRQYNNVYTEVSSGEPLLHRYPTPLSDYSVWTIGTNGSQGPYSQNGVISENTIIEDTDPFGVPTAIWECSTTGANDGSGGWNQDFPCDASKTYRLSVFVRKRVNLADGSTYLGCHSSTTQNLSGTANTNPYFFNGDLPSLDEWYLMVGVIHPSGYSGGDTGLAGVYNMSGSRVIDGTEFRMTPGATTQRHRCYMFYATNSTSRQDFVYPRVEEIDGTEPKVDDLIKAMKYMPVYNGPAHGVYTESSRGWWIGLETSYVRYIRDRVAGNTINTGDHWAEIEAYGEPELNDIGTRTEILSLNDAGRITNTSIDWTDRPAWMASTGSFVYIPYNPNMNITNEITIEAEICWMGPFNNDGDNRGTIFTNTRSYYTQIKADGKLSFFTYPDGGGSTYMDSTSILEIGRWYHVAFTEDTSGYRRIYIDGVLDNGEQHEVGIRSVAADARPAGIGSETSTFDRVNNAAIRNVRLWDYQRSQATIASEMYDRLVGNETGLRGYWPLDHGAGDVATDLTGGSDGIIANARWITTTVETNVSLDNGSTWQGWKTVNKGDSIPDIPFDADGRKVLVDCRQTLDSTNCEAPVQMDDITVSATGRITVTKKWNGSQWVDVPFRRWDGSQWVECETRVGVDGRWL